MDNELDELLNDNTEIEAAPVNHKRKSLGRGLGALLGSEALPMDDEDFTQIKSSNYVRIEEIVPCKYQPRTEFDQEALQSLAESIKEKGVLQPLLVRKTNGGFELIAGERRWRASKMAGLDEVPVIIKDFDDKEVLEVALVENLLRENLSAIEEAEGLQRLIDEFSHTQDALAQIMGKSRSYIANTLRLLNLPQSVQYMVKENKLSAGHARALIGLENAEELAKKIIAKGLNVRQVEDLVAKQKDNPKPRSTKERSEDLEQIEKDLIKKLGLRLQISSGKNGGGKVVIPYSSVAELDMIISVLERKKDTFVSGQQNAVFKDDNSTTNEKFSIKIID